MLCDPKELTQAALDVVVEIIHTISVPSASMAQIALDAFKDILAEDNLREEVGF